MTKKMLGNIKTFTIMKKVFFICTAALLAAVGCNKEISDGLQPVGSVILKAVVENDGTKVGATIDKEEGTVAFTWTKGDAVAVQAGNSFETFNLVGNGGTSDGEFSGNVQPSVGAVAVSPAAMAGAVAGNELTLNLPAEYTYVEGQTNALMFATVKEDNKMLFRHLGGILQVTMQGIPSRAAECVVTAAGKKINGAYSVDYTADEPVVALADAATEAESTVTIKLTEAVTDMTLNIPLPAGDYPSISVSLLDASGAVINGSVIETTTTKSIARKTLKAMPGVVLSCKDLFLTPDGAGNKSGSDWGNAMGFDEFEALVSNDQGAPSKEECAILDGATFHVAGGKYVMTKNKDRFKLQFSNYGKPCNIAFIGGYDPNSTGKDLSKRNTSTFETKFTGDKNGNNKADQSEDSGIFCMDSWSFVSFDGITFCYTGSVAANKWKQGAFVMNTGDRLQLTLNNCKFTDLYTWADNTNGLGAALHVITNSAVKATNCTFTNCVSQSNGGAIAVAHASGTVELNGCTFTKCTSSNGMGGAIGMNAGGKVNVSGCTFTACSALSGGAVVMNSGGEMSVTNSTFDACTATNEHGAAIKLTQSSPLMKLNGCVFKNGDPKKRAGAIFQDSKSILFMNGCSFYGNKTNDNWGSSIVSSAHMYMNNCTFGEDLKGGQLINGAGNWCIVNTTAVSVNDGANELRNTAFRYTGSGYLLVMNTIALYTNSANNKGGIYSETNSINSYGYNAYDKATNFTATTSDLTGQTLSSLGLTWNTGYYSWNGPLEEQPKATLAEVENAIKTGCPVAYGSYTNLGQTFYDWLQEIGDGKNPLAYDQLGNARNTNAMWPGAYEKHN